MSVEVRLLYQNDVTPFGIVTRRYYSLSQDKLLLDMWSLRQYYSFIAGFSTSSSWVVVLVQCF
jgi:hypothetical protein